MYTTSLEYNTIQYNTCKHNATLESVKKKSNQPRSSLPFPSRSRTTRPCSSFALHLHARCLLESALFPSIIIIMVICTDTDMEDDNRVMVCTHPVARHTEQDVVWLLDHHPSHAQPPKHAARSQGHRRPVMYPPNITT